MSVRQFSVLVEAAPDVPGQWTSHALNWDVVSQGDSPYHALKMLLEALCLILAEDADAGLDSDKRSAAPLEFWERYEKTLQFGMRVSPADVDRLGPGTVIAAVMYLREEKTPDFERDFSEAPHPFMTILERGRNEAHC